jgi:hypothetical protein
MDVNIQSKLMLNSVYEIQDMKINRESKKKQLLLFCKYFFWRARGVLAISLHMSPIF